MKICTKCKIEKPLDEFRNSKLTKSGKQSWCKDCTRIAVHNCMRTPKRKLDLARASRKHLYKKKYNISIEQYNELLESQNYLCKICNKESNKTLCIDHNHITGKTRGLLCHRCNAAIGLLDEKLDNLNSAIKYLKEYN